MTTTPDTLAGRVRAVLAHDGIPAAGHLAHLREAFGISASTARRILAGHRISTRTFAKLADGLQVSWRWLHEGRIDQIDPRTMRIDAQHAKGFSPADADKLARLMLGYMAGHRRAVNLCRLATTGNLPMIEASRLYARRQ